MKRSLLWLPQWLAFSSPSSLQGKEWGRPKTRTCEAPCLQGPGIPGQPEVLRQSITDTLSKANPSGAEGKVVSLIVPHAGHVYSGQVAAYSYKLLQTASPRVVVLIGPSHRVGFRGVSVSQYSGYKTPLGVAPVDRDVTKKLLSTHPQMKWVSQADHQEHSLEIQIPFIQTVLKDFRIVPILMGDQDLETCALLAKSLSRSCRTGKRP